MGWKGIDIQAGHLNNNDENVLDPTDTINIHERYLVDGRKKSRFYGLSAGTGGSSESENLSNYVDSQRGVTVTVGPRILGGAEDGVPPEEQTPLMTF